MKGPVRLKGFAFLVHPALFALAPALFIYSHNIASAVFLDFWRPALALTGASLALTLVLWPLLRDRHHAALVVSVFFLLFFSFGPAYDSMGGRKWAFLDLGDPRTLGAVYGALFLAVAAAGFFFRSRLPGVTKFLNLMALVWAGISMASIIVYPFSSGAVRARTPLAAPLGAPAGGTVSPAERPDIYYFIFDTYGRQDILREHYDYDNGWFIDELKRMGFFVASKSVSNYMFTALSIASALNMDYLKTYPEGTLTEEDAKALVHQANHRNPVMKFLKDAGYGTVAFGTPYASCNFTEADVFLDCQGGKSEFYQILFAMTPLRWVRSLWGEIDPAEAERRRALFNFRKVPEVTAMGGPTFTFVHFIPPRHPFVFGRNGEPINKGEARYRFGRNLKPEYVQLHRDHVHFVSGKILTMVREILKRSGKPPVIILQGDHGPSYGVNYKDPSAKDARQKMSILNAYYLPGGGKPDPYDSISPVNTFRLIFDRYFGAALPFLEDRCYFCENFSLTTLKDVTDKVRSVPADFPNA